MSTQYAFGKIVTNGLVLALDAADRNSYVSGSATWYDLSGNNSGSLTSIGYTSSNGGALVFNGSTSIVSINSIPTSSFSLISSSFTVNAWVYLITGSSQGIFSSNQSPTNGGQYAFVVRSNNLVSSFYGNPIPTDLNSLTMITGSWSYITNTFNYSTQTNSIYINGVYKNSNNMSTSPLLTSASLNIGWYAYGGAYLTGSIGSVHIYNRDLSSQEILQNYNAQKSRFNL